MFTHLRTRLTVLYAGLFGVALILLAGAVYVAVRGNADQAIRNELAASGTVFDRVWALKSGQLQDSADLLARDFGFRAAVATGDEATVDSALENLRQRLAIERAFIVYADGRIGGIDTKAFKDRGVGLWTTLSESDSASGVLIIDGRPHHAIAAPILSPGLTGWVVFAAKLDAAEMRSLEKLSAIPLTAEVLTRRGQGSWLPADTAAPRDAATSPFITKALAVKDGGPRTLDGGDGQSAALVKRLPSVDQNEQAVLLLRYPMAKALAPYQPLLASVLAIGVLGMAMTVAGSWALSRSLTRPISALDEAARRLQRGETPHVEVETHDEIGRLAQSFNTMAAAIGERERRITHLAMHDAETGLPNLVALEQALEILAPAPGRLLIVGVVGVDRFEFIRGAIGYRLTAQMVGEVGGRLAALPMALSVARLSTATLALVFEAADLGDARVLAADALAVLEEPVVLDGERVDVALTMGLAACGLSDQAAPSPIQRGAIALDQARAGHRKTALFDELAYGDPSSNLSLISDLRGAMAGGELTIHHQPKYDLRRADITGVEVLARWRHPTRGMISPDLFIGMAEETGHILQVTEYVLARAIADQKALRQAGHPVTVSVNISGRLMNDAEFATRALAMIRKAKADICFEITETAVIDNPELALPIIERLVKAGVGISIDDYGSGLSSLTYLKQIQASELKIDKSFVTALSSGQRDALLVKSTIDLAHALGLKVVAEGVETSEALALLTGMGCDLAQGYLIGRPMALPDLLTVLAEAKTRRMGAA